MSMGHVPTGRTRPSTAIRDAHRHEQGSLWRFGNDRNKEGDAENTWIINALKKKTPMEQILITFAATDIATARCFV
jgi:hypothetical protein